LNQRRKNAFQYRLRISKHIMIPKSDHAKSETRQIPSALQIERQIVRVLPAVNLHDQSCANADEVHDVASDRLLSPEAVLAEVAVAQMTP
jgi:hypothetical protein